MRVLKEEALLGQGMVPVFPKGLPILLILKTAGEIHAVENKCPHMGCPLHRGRLNGYILQCACHDWQFDIRSGVFTDAPEIRLRCYEWKIADGYICIKM